MVFYNFNYDDFPNVKIVFKNKVNNSEMDELFLEWERIYERKRDFNIIFDVTEIKSPTASFAYRMANFINTLKTKKPQYYKKSYVVAPDSGVMKFLINLTFKITKPVSKVYICWKKSGEEINVNNVVSVFNKDPFRFDFIDNK